MAVAKVPPLRSRAHSVSDALVAHLEQLIALGELGPGDRLPAERELAESLSVSRTSLREALHQLEAKHLIERRQGRGTIVLAPPTQVDDLYARLADVAEDDRELANVAELRTVIEPKIAEFAAVRATSADLLQMDDILHATDEHLLAAKSLELDIQFHLTLARASHNPLLTALTTMVSSWTTPVRKDSHSTREGRRKSLIGHQAIRDAVEARDPVAASQAMIMHLADIDQVIRRTRHDGAASAEQD
ncbi:FadR family transcriptional regulator [Streptomyces sp. PSKA54]|uniref:FadR family transcriptional regulator n=1 Tax=Streptomyces himalayensis subsp. aureolus TaxID=2758039 RepID=A0A7W2D2D9_9ACTN|nr:FadR/GntR family transcriptional regulator [Streptomyces himalayensis]MBA4863468.1 FadR family transcriptional regulator [Streptomyces himalayensis subsp. aureolus]